MTNFLLKLFVKNYNNTADPAVHAAIGKLAGIVGIVCNCLLTIGKLVVGLIIGSVSITADAVNNLSDAASSVVTLFGFRLAQRPADKEHPFGHARYEYLSGLAIAAMILFFGAELIKSSVDKIIHPEPLEISIFTVTILAASILIKIWMSYFFKSLGIKINSTTLLATSIDSRNDVIATSAVLLGYLINSISDLNADGYVGLLVAAFIIYSGIKIAKETISPLLGKKADKNLTEKISQLILSYEKVLGIHDLLIHDYGPGQCYASVHAELRADEDSIVCHDIIDSIERDVLEKLNVNLVIHYDPVVMNDNEKNEMQRIIENITHNINSQFSIHDFRILHDKEHPKLIFDLSIPYSMADKNKEIKKEIDNKLSEAGKNYTTIIHFDGKD